MEGDEFQLEDYDLCWHIPQADSRKVRFQPHLPNQTDLSLKNGYTTKDLPQGFWEATKKGMQVKDQGVRREKVIPIICKRIPLPHLGQAKHTLYYLADISRGKLKTITNVFIEVDQCILQWSKSFAREHIVSLTVIELKKKLIINEARQNPLKNWNDAAWYVVHHSREEEHFYIWFSWLEVEEQNIKLQRPNNYAWLLMNTKLWKMGNEPVKGWQSFTIQTIDFLEGLIEQGQIDSLPSPPKPPSKKKRVSGTFNADTHLEDSPTLIRRRERSIEPVKKDNTVDSTKKNASMPC